MSTITNNVSATPVAAEMKVEKKVVTECLGHEIKVGSCRHRNRIMSIVEKHHKKMAEDTSVLSCPTHTVLEEVKNRIGKGKHSEFVIYANVTHADNTKKCDNNRTIEIIRSLV